MQAQALGFELTSAAASSSQGKFLDYFLLAGISKKYEVTEYL